MEVLWKQPIFAISPTSFLIPPNIPTIPTSTAPTIIFPALFPSPMDGDDHNGAAAFDKDEEAEEKAEILRDRFRLSAVSIVESEVKKQGMEIAEPVVACVADLAFKFTEQLARDVELFAQHAGRKSVNMEDVIISAHRNEHLVGLLRSFAQELKGKEPAIEKKRKRSSKKKQSPDEGEFSAL